MARYSAGTVVDFSKSVRIVVIGDKGTGKSSLIAAAATNSFPPNVPPVLPDTKLPLQFFPDGIAVTIVDTSSRPEDRGMVAEELKHADAVVLTHASDDRPETLQRLSTYWLPELRRLEVKVPIIVAGCKLDLDKNQVSFEQVMSPIMNQFREIETCIECSALKQIQAQEVFYYAQKNVIHPTAPLFDQETQALKPRCVRALKRIFILCDHDKDGALNEAELDQFQVKCFNAPLQPNEIEGIKRVVQERLPEGVNEIGLTVAGFLFLHALFIEKGRIETTWTVLRKFGYNNDVRLANEWLPPSLFKRAPDQSVELTDVAIEFLKEKYMLFDADGDNNLRPQEIEDLFSTAPESPWKEAPYEDAAERTAIGGLSSDAFLSLWSLMTLLEPARSVEHLICIGFQGDPLSAIRITRRRLLDRKKKRCERKVVQCFVFGPNSARKSALLNCFLGRSYADNPGSTTDERYAVNMVDETGSAKKTLVMREIPEDGAQGLFSSMESLAKCDIAVFVYDSSDESSWKRASELLVEVANHGEATGYEVPCLMVSAKDDIVSSQIPIQDSTRVTQDVGIEHHVSISSKLEDFNNLFRKIITAAQHPHLSIPETEAGKSRKHYNRKINRFLMVVSIVAAVVVVGLAAYFVYVSQERVLLPEKIENEGPKARTMLDINLFREEKGNDPEIIRESQRRRFADVDLVDEVINLDKEWRQRQFEVDGLRLEFNKLNKQVAKLKISGADASEVIQQAEKNKQDAADKEKEVSDAYAKLKEKLVKVGNLVPDSVPVSNDEADNPVIKVWGEKPVFAPGQKVLNHVDLVEKTFIADNRRGAEIAGGRGYFLRGHGVLLNQALINFGLQFLRKRKFTPFQPPFLMRKDVMAKSAQLSEFDEQLYKVTGKGKDKDVTGEGDGKYLIATAEQPLCAYHMNEWIPLKELPIKYAGYSTCFRTEAGSHGRDQLGLFRVHQFEKIEQFCITSPDENNSWKMLEDMMKNSEEFYKELKLPYRVVEIVSGALNDAAAKKYDLEGWFPASGTYRELVSCSNCTDYQARRLEIRYGQKKSNEETKYVHMLNSTLTATERTICCILENYQRENGVEVPEVLQQFMEVELLPFRQ
ncbi:unnamed protein product [Brassica rapa subsp. narinosa]